MARHKIAVIPGDGIGKEVVPEGLRVLDAAARRFGIELQLDHFDWSCDYYARHGSMMPSSWKELIGQHDALFFGAVGWPATVPDHVSLWGMLIKFRREFDQYVNLRPCRLMPGIRTPLADRKPGDIDFFVVRENTEGEYSSVGGRMYEGTEREVVFQQACFSRKGVDRILKFAFELARKRPKKRLTSATKSNGISITMPYWDERVEAMAKQYPDIRWDKFHIDILTAHFVAHPDWFDVVVASNLFGDILSDLGPACTGTIGIAPSANINPERVFPSLFEPVHGSAPDIYGKGIANPIGQIWAAAMMLEHLGHPKAGEDIVTAIETVLDPKSGAPRGDGGDHPGQHRGGAVRAREIARRPQHDRGPAIHRRQHAEQDRSGERVEGVAAPEQRAQTAAIGPAGQAERAGHSQHNAEPPERAGQSAGKHGVGDHREDRAEREDRPDDRDVTARACAGQQAAHPRHQDARRGDGWPRRPRRRERVPRDEEEAQPHGERHRLSPGDDDERRDRTRAALDDRELSGLGERRGQGQREPGQTRPACGTWPAENATAGAVCNARGIVTRDIVRQVASARDRSRHSSYSRRRAALVR